MVLIKTPIKALRLAKLKINTEMMEIVIKLIET